MKAPIIYESSYIDGNIEMFNDIEWDNVQRARGECFMSDIEREYQYIKDGPIYKSRPMHPLVNQTMCMINSEYGYKLDVCFLNYYADKTKGLGWHADDSHPIDQTQPIAVVSFGSEREIWTKPMDFQGVIPDEWKTKLPNGSLFIMLPGCQSTHKHRIPRHHTDCGPRISLTFRSWKK